MNLEKLTGKYLDTKRHSFGSGAGLFQYVQLFVISNGVNTKYFANNHINYLNFKQTFFWSDENNNKVTNLPEFADEFLEPCHISKMICKYIVLAEKIKTTYGITAISILCNRKAY